MAVNDFTRTYLPVANGGTTAADQAAMDASSYVPKLYANTVLYEFYKSTVFKEIFNSDYEGEFKNKGDAINIRQAPTIDTGIYNPGGAAANVLDYQVPLNDDITMAIDQAIYTAFKVDSVDKLQADVDLMGMYTKDGTERLNIEVDREVMEYISGTADPLNMGAVAGANTGSIDLGTDVPLVAGTGALQIGASSAETPGSNLYNAVNVIVRMGQVLDEQNVPKADRWVVIPSAYQTRLLTSELKGADITGDSTGAIRTGLIGQINGMMIYVSENLPTGGDATSAVYAGTKAACSFALQMSATESGNLENQFGQYMRTLWVYGRETIKPEALVQAWCDFI